MAVRTKRTYNLSSATVRRVRELADEYGAARTQDGVVERVRAHLDAGADHVCVQLRSADARDLCQGGYRELFAALGELG